jgi:hypothetical protein
MSASGYSQPARASSKSGHVSYAAECGSNFTVKRRDFLVSRGEPTNDSRTADLVRGYLGSQNPQIAVLDSTCRRETAFARAKAEAKIRPGVASGGHWQSLVHLRGLRPYELARLLIEADFDVTLLGQLHDNVDNLGLTLCAHVHPTLLENLQHGNIAWQHVRH